MKISLYLVLLTFVALALNDITSSEKEYKIGEVYCGQNPDPNSPHKRVYATITWSSWDEGYGGGRRIVGVTWAGGAPLKGEHNYAKSYFAKGWELMPHN